MSTGPMRRSGAERLLQNISRAAFVKLLQDAHIYDIVEITRQDDIPKAIRDPSVSAGRPSSHLHHADLDDSRLTRSSINSFSIRRNF
jgi:hypothetical protein